MTSSTSFACRVGPHALAGVLLLWLAQAAQAQAGAAPHESPVRQDLRGALTLAAQLGEETLNWVGREHGQERVVKGAPYCADAVHESIQPLADGNRIVHRQSSRLCRDGEGRTRQELTSREGRRTIYLRDPVAGESWVLDPERKTARRSGFAAVARWGGAADHSGALDATAWREYAQHLRDWARQVAERARDGTRTGAAAHGSATAPPVPPVPPSAQVAGPAGSPSTVAPVIIARAGRSEGDHPSHEVDVQVLRLSREAMAGAPPMPGMAHFSFDAPPPAVGFSTGRFAPRGPAVVSPLPARDIEGQRAHGERHTWTIEAGKLGNEKPIVITREVWTSPELMLTLLSRDSDPRSGEVSYRLQNLRRGEPDAGLMKVPADYEQSRRSLPRAPSAPAGRG